MCNEIRNVSKTNIKHNFNADHVFLSSKYLSQDNALPVNCNPNFSGDIQVF